MNIRLVRSMGTATLGLAVAVGAIAGVRAQDNERNDGRDFGLQVQHWLHASAPRLFGIVHPLEESAVGPYAGTDVNGASVEVAQSLRVRVISSAVHPQADMIAFWPNDDEPTAVYVCIEAGAGDPAVQRVDLSGNPSSNARTILRGLVSCDPIRRTAWGTGTRGRGHCS